MKFWVWEMNEEKPAEPTYEGRSETDAASAFVRASRWFGFLDELLVRVDDEMGHRYEFRVRVDMEPRITVESIDE